MRNKYFIRMAARKKMIEGPFDDTRTLQRTSENALTYVNRNIRSRSSRRHAVAEAKMADVTERDS